MDAEMARRATQSMRMSLIGLQMYRGERYIPPDLRLFMPSWDLMLLAPAGIAPLPTRPCNAVVTLVGPGVLGPVPRMFYRTSDMVVEVGWTGPLQVGIASRVILRDLAPLDADVRHWPDALPLIPKPGDVAQRIESVMAVVIGWLPCFRTLYTQVPDERAFIQAFQQPDRPGLTGLAARAQVCAEVLHNGLKPFGLERRIIRQWIVQLAEGAMELAWIEQVRRALHMGSYSVDSPFRVGPGQCPPPPIPAPPMSEPCA